MFPFIRSVAMLAAALVLAGCAGLPRERAYAETRDLIAAQRTLPAEWSPLNAETVAPASGALSIDDAVRTAFFNNPSLREEFARLGFGRAELEDARRISNPSLGYLRLSPGQGDGSQVTRSLSLGLTDLLLLPARKRLAEAELERLQMSVASSALSLATEVEAAWYAAVGSGQIATMRELVARAGQHSAELAQRFFDAGNINRLQLEQELAAASQARIEAVGARADALRARHALARMIGVPASAEWSLPSQLGAPRASEYSSEDLVALALETRLDLAAARKAVEVREDALGVTRRWRWVGDVEVGYEREREIDGGLLRGPSVSLALPIFNQGQGDLMRAEAELAQARADLDAAVLSVHNDARLGVEAVQVARIIAEQYRTEIVPRREAIVARTQEEVNFMLVGVFELLLAKQQEYDAYQAYLEAVRDYWIARSELRAAVGGRLPDDGAPVEATIGPDALVPAAAALDSVDHAHHSTNAVDPHAGHQMSKPAPEPDPHAGHRRGERDAESESKSHDAEHAHEHGDQP